MRLSTATTILFAAATLANPAPIANPEASSLEISTDAPSLAPEVDARAAGLILEGRDPSSSSSSKSSSSKGGKGSKGGNNTQEDSAAAMLSSNVVLELGALGLSFLLWV
jgi:hypothetical protein